MALGPEPQAQLVVALAKQKAAVAPLSWERTAETRGVVNLEQREVGSVSRQDAGAVGPDAEWQ